MINLLTKLSKIIAKALSCDTYELQQGWEDERQRLEQAILYNTKS